MLPDHIEISKPTVSANPSAKALDDTSARVSVPATSSASRVRCARLRRPWTPAGCPAKAASGPPGL